MRHISKNCKTLKQAEQQQNRLYGQYDRVRLIQSPTFEEEGLYVWEVGEDEFKTFGGLRSGDSSQDAYLRSKFGY